MNERTPQIHERTPRTLGAAQPAGLLHGRRGLFAILFVSALFLASVGAFDTSHAPIGRLISYWLSVMLIGGVIALGVLGMFGRTGWADDRPWLQATLIVLAISVPQTLVVWALATSLLDRTFDTAGVVTVFPTVALVSAAVAALYVLGDRSPVKTQASTETNKPPLFLARLPLRLQNAELYAVQAEGHYVRIYTERGSELLLMRLAQAIAELDGIEGAQTHRSWWVSKAAVTGASRGEGRARLVLKGGTEAPVSRTYAKALRDGGWFKRF